jgi:hypothetical protein
MNEDNPRAESVKRWIAREASGDQLVAELLWHSVGRVILASDIATTSIAAELLDMAMETEAHRNVRHVADWLKVAVAEKAPWLARVDDLGRPKKLMKLNSLEAIVAEADKQMRRKQSGLAKAAAVAGDEEMHFDLGDGWSLVKLLSEAALDRESRAMQHCIGHGAYDDYLETDDALLLSLRDPFGNPHATTEVVGGRLVQCQGKQNKAPVEKYVSRVLPYLSERKIQSDTGGFVTDVHDVVHTMGNLPEVLEVNGSLHLWNGSETSLRLPREIRCHGGDLRISGNAFSNVPEYISCIDLRVTGVSIPSLPPSLKVSGGIDLNASRIAVLPDNLWVRGGLQLTGTPIMSLPRGLRVDGFLSVSHTNIKQFPDDIRTGGIGMRGTAVKRIDTAWIGAGVGEPKNLLARGSALEEIVGTPIFYSLEVAETKVKTLPDGLQVHDLDISGSSVSSIQSDARITGDLTARNCPDLRIEVESVGQNVVLGNSRIVMPEAFECGGILTVDSDVEAKLPSRLKVGILKYHANAPLQGSVEADIVEIDSPHCKRLEGRLKARELRVARKFEFFGPEAEVQEVLVGDWMSGLTRLSFDQAKKAISLHGNLQKDHRGEPTTSRFLSLLSGMPGTGKTYLASNMLANERLHRRRRDAFMVDIETVPDVPATLVPRYGDFASMDRQLRRDAEAAHQAQRELMNAPIRQTPILPLAFPLLRPIASRHEARRQENHAANPPEWWGEMRAGLERNMQTYVHRPLIDGRPGAGRP